MFQSWMKNHAEDAAGVVQKNLDREKAFHEMSIIWHPSILPRVYASRSSSDVSWIPCDCSCCLTYSLGTSTLLAAIQETADDSNKSPLV